MLAKIKYFFVLQYFYFFFFSVHDLYTLSGQPFTDRSTDNFLNSGNSYITLKSWKTIDTIDANFTESNNW